MSQVFVNVHLKQKILDPQGRAILSALQRIGIENVSEVRQGKQFKLNLSGDITNEKLEEIKQLAETLLSNPVIEDFSIEVKNDS